MLGGDESGKEESRTHAIESRRSKKRKKGDSRPTRKSARDQAKQRNLDTDPTGQDAIQTPPLSTRQDSPLYSDQPLGIDKISEKISDASDSSSDYQIPQTSSLARAMDWNGSGKSSVRTSLRSAGDLGQNRLATGFRPRSERSAKDDDPPSYEVVEISDDSDVMDDSEGGILLNVDVASGIDSSDDLDTPIEISDDEDGEVDEYEPPAQIPTLLPRPGTKSAAPKSTNSKSGITSTMFKIDVSPSSRILADLNPDELERQIKYALFHLRRDQIDLSRPAMCLVCLNEGHSDDLCPGLVCVTCGGQTRHANRLCPKRTRCSQCGTRGHSSDRCKLKPVKAASDPCDFCGASDHVEASCTRRFFPARAERPGEVQLWISCARCGSKEHMAGDCSAFGSYASAWSLRGHGLSRDKVVNLSLQRGVTAREKEAENQGVRPQGMMQPSGSRGASSRRGNPRGGGSGGAQSRVSKFDADDDDFTSRLASKNPSRKPAERNANPFDNKSRHHADHSHGASYYEPRRPAQEDVDSYRPAPSHDHRNRYNYRGEDRKQYPGEHYQRRRSRSRSPRRNQFEHLDSWRPPLPREPPPPPPPLHPQPPPPPPPSSLPPPASLPARPGQNQQQQQQQSSTGQQTSKKARRRAAKEGRGGSAGTAYSGGIPVQSMPSAGQQAWKKGEM